MSDDVPDAASGEGDPVIPGEDEVFSELDDISLTPEEHQQVKDVVNGDLMMEIQHHDKRYLVAGEGGDSGAATRRRTVYDLLDARRKPQAVAFKLEDFGLTTDEMQLWCRVFDILCGVATHIVSVIEDFDGGYVWELGLLYSSEYRGKVWVLKRHYPNRDTEHAHYENGMAASHVQLLLDSDRCIEWIDAENLPEAVTEIP